MVILAGDNHAGGLPVELVQKLARLAAPSPLERARALAIQAHAGQVDKAGKPYIEHPQRIASRVAGDDLAARVAWLHDVVEDTDVTPEEIRRQFGDATAKAVDALTRRRDEDSDAYYARVRSNRTALRVKLADIADNTDPERMAQLNAATRHRLTLKYREALWSLGATEYARLDYDNGSPPRLIRRRHGQYPEMWSRQFQTWNESTTAFDALHGMSSTSNYSDLIFESEARVHWPEAFD